MLSTWHTSVDDQSLEQNIQVALPGWESVDSGWKIAADRNDLRTSFGGLAALAAEKVFVAKSAWVGRGAEGLDLTASLEGAALPSKD